MRGCKEDREEDVMEDEDDTSTLEECCEAVMVVYTESEEVREGSSGVLSVWVLEVESRVSLCDVDGGIYVAAVFGIDSKMCDE